MRKRPLFLYACVFLAGLVCYRYEKKALLVVLVIWLGYEWCRLLPHKRIKLAAGRSLILLSAFILGNVHMQNEMAFRDSYLSKIKDGETITVWGEISKIETTSVGTPRVVLSDCYIGLSEGALPCNDVMVFTSSDHFRVGEVHKITGKLHMFEHSRNEGGFDSFIFYLSQKIDLCIYEKESQLLSTSQGWTKAKLIDLKSAFDMVYETCSSEKTAGFLSSMILGDKSDLDQALKALFTNGGIAHILAISGLHVSIIGRGFYQWLRKRGVGYSIAGTMAGLMLCAYCYMAGSGMSAIRAVGMMLIFFLGQMLGRSYDMLNALGAMVVFLLWENPFLLEYSGFWFSVLALIGVGFVGNAFSKAVESVGCLVPQEGDVKKSAKSVWKNLGKNFGMSLGISLSTLPVVAYCYYEIPLYSPVVNCLLLPVLTPIFVLALAGGFAGLLWPGVASWILMPCELGLQLYEWVCQMVQRLPGAMIITGIPSAEAIAAYYVVLLVGTMGLKYLVKQRKKKVHVLACASAVSVVCFVLIVYPKPQNQEITFLDVGQGDGIYICTGDGVSFFIDGGSTDVDGLGQYRILPFLKSKDIEKIDYWFVTHADTDHISGLLEVMESGYCIEHLVVAETAIVTKTAVVVEVAEGANRTTVGQLTTDEILDENMSNLLENARKLAIDVVFMETGDFLTTKNTKLTCLYPSQDEIEKNPSLAEDRNEASLVLEYVSHRFGEEEEFRAIFTGDISSEIEKQLLEENKLQKAWLYKAAHHGSKYSNASETLFTLSPEIAVVSCGANNFYGHPAAEAISNMQAAGADIHYTMDVGQITIRVCEDEIAIVEYLRKEE